MREKKVSNVYQHQFFIVLNFSPLLQFYNERVYNVYFVTTAKKTQQKALYVYYIRGVDSTIYDTHNRQVHVCEKNENLYLNSWQ